MTTTRLPTPLWPVLFGGLLLALAACTAGTPTPPPTIAPQTPTAAPPHANAGPLPGPTAQPPHATPTAAPTATPLPAPPLSQPLRPAAWLQNPDLGGIPDNPLAVGPQAATFATVLRIGRGYTTAAAFEPQQERLALARLTGVYVCTPPQGDLDNLPCDMYLEHNAFVIALAFHPQAPHQLVTLDLDGRLRLWDLRAQPPTATLLSSAVEGINANAALLFDPQGRYLVVLRNDFFALWDWEARQMRPLPTHFPGEAEPVGPVFMHAAALSPDGETLALLTEEQLFTLALNDDKPTWQPGFPLPFAPQEGVVPNGVAIASVPLREGWGWVVVDDALRIHLVAADGVTLLRTWENLPEPDWGTPLAHGPLDASQPHIVAPAGDGTFWVSLAQNNLYRLDPAQSKVLQTLPYLPEGAGGFVANRRNVLLTPAAQGRQLLAVWRDGTVQVWNLDEGQRQGQVVDWSDLHVEGVAFDPWMRQLFLLRYHLPAYWSWQAQFLSEMGPTEARRLALAGDGCHLLWNAVVTDPAIDAYCQNSPGWNEDAFVDFPGNGVDIAPAYAAGRNWLAVAAYEGATEVTVWDLSTGEHLATLDASSVGRAYSLALTTDGRWLFVGGTQGRIGVWDMGNQTWTATWDLDQPPGSPDAGSDGEITALALVQHETQLAAVREDGQGAFFALPEGRPVRTFHLATRTRMNKVVWWAWDPKGEIVAFKPFYGPGIMVTRVADAAPPTPWVLPGVSQTYTTAQALAPDGRLLAHGGLDGGAWVVDLVPILVEAQWLDPEQALPLPVPPALARGVPSFRSTYEVQATVAGQTYPVLQVESQGQGNRARLTVRGPAWPKTGEYAEEPASVIPYRYRTHQAAAWQAALSGDLPPTTPVLRGWPWQAQGAVGEVWRYTSDDPDAAVLPPLRWLQQALPFAVWDFKADAFDGRVDLSPQGVLLAATLVWQGVLRGPQGEQAAELRVTYTAGDFGAVELPPMPDDAGAADQGAAPGEAFITPEGVPLPPNALATEEEGVYIVPWPTEQVQSWLRDALSQYDFFIEQESQEVVAGTRVDYWIVSQGATRWAIYFLSISDGTGVLLAPP